MEVPFEIENAQMLEWIASGKGDVYIEINKEKLLPMRRILPDVYCFATILFREKRAGIAFLRAIWMYRSKPERWSAGRRIHPRNHPLPAVAGNERSERN